MSEQEPHDLRRQELPFTLEEMTRSANTLTPVHGRFNLAVISPDALDVIQTDESSDQHRYLVVPTDPLSQHISKSLQESGIPQLEILEEDNRMMVHRVPLQAKPLIKERLFPELESTDTYISDRELFEELGVMWRRIYDSATYMPVDTLLARTGLMEFTKKTNRLFPVPPYADWRKFQHSGEALKHFERQILSELKEAYPQVEIEGLCLAATSGFKRSA